VGVIVARSDVPLDDFGVFNLALFVHLFVISVLRAFPMEPLADRCGTVDAATWRRWASAALGAIVLVASLTAIALLATGAVVVGALGAALAALGIAFPGLVMQVAGRMTFFAAGRGGASFVNGLVWAIALVPAFAIAGLAGRGVFAVMLSWALARATAGVTGTAQARLVPRPDLARA